MGEAITIATAEDIARLRQEIRELKRTLEGCTIIPPPEWVSVSRAAELHGVASSTIHRWIASGQIEAKGSGKARRVKVDQSNLLARSAAVAS